jgi:putative ABC transport system permease protein
MDSDRDRREEDLKDEVAFHLAAETQRRVDAGDTPARARAAARRAFGNVPLVEDVTRQMWGPMMIRERALHDIRFAVRLLKRDPSFTAVAVSTLALGIAATITVFAVLKGVLLNPLPFPDPDRLVMVYERTPNGEERNYASLFNVLNWQERNQSFEHLASLTPLPMNLTGAGDAEQLDGFAVLGDFFGVLGTKALLGRTFVPDDGDGVIVISYGLWQQRFGGSRDAIGRVISLNGVAREIVGVMPRGFAFPAARAAQIYTPMPVDRSGRPGGRSLTSVARLKAGVTLDAARADMRRVVAQLIAEGSPGVSAGWSASVFPLFDETVASVRRVLWVLLASVSSLLLLACANVANLLLIRSAKRAPELAVRMVLGAGRWRLAHQLAAESALLTLSAGIIGLGIAVAVMPAIPSLFPVTFPLPRAADIRIDRSIVVFTILVCGAITMTFGLLPIARLARERFGAALKAGGRSALATHARLRRSLVVAEVAIALLLVFAAGLMGKSLIELYNVNPGFNAERVLTLRMLMLPSKYFLPDSRIAFLRTVLEEIRSRPGIVGASSVHFLPLSGVGSGAPVFRRDKPRPPAQQLAGFPVSVIADGYFATMGIPLRGRDFSGTDRLGTPGVAIVNESMARQLFADEDPIGKHITAMYSPNTQDLEIVGVAGDVRTSTLDREPGPALYIAHNQEPSLFASLVVRTQGRPADAIATVRGAIARVDAEQGVSQVQPLDTLIANASAKPRVQAGVFGIFGVLALIIAAVGLYGVMAYSVEQRRREIGLQLALGAPPRTLLQGVVREGVVLASIGALAGAAVAWALSGTLQALLYDTRAADPRMFIAAGATLIAVACLATLAPALRATRVDPLVVLREE